MHEEIASHAFRRIRKASLPAVDVPREAQWPGTPIDMQIRCKQWKLPGSKAWSASLRRTSFY